MPGKIFLHLLIICVIWYQEITGTVAERSLDYLLRQKRVINRIQGEDESVLINTAPYIVKVKRFMRITCVGSILSHQVVITIAQCVGIERSEYHVLSGAARLENGVVHNVTNIIKRIGHHPHRPEDGIALLTIDPPIVYRPHSFAIQLHSAPLLPGTLGTVSGWGYNARTNDPGTDFTRSLRSIEVPIMAHRDCVRTYAPYTEISELDICTFHPQKCCGHIDGGAPLVVDGFLAGVHLWTGPGRIQYNPEYPDVFALLQHSAYNQWIRSHI